MMLRHASAARGSTDTARGGRVGVRRAATAAGHVRREMVVGMMVMVVEVGVVGRRLLLLH